MNKKENTKSVLLYPVLFFRHFIFPLTTAIHADTREEPSVEKRVSLTERTSLFLNISSKVIKVEALQLTSAAFQSKFTANTLQNWWTQSGWSVIKIMGTP